MCMVLWNHVGQYNPITSCFLNQWARTHRISILQSKTWSLLAIRAEFCWVELCRGNNAGVAIHSICSVATLTSVRRRVVVEKVCLHVSVCFCLCVCVCVYIKKGIAPCSDSMRIEYADGHIQLTCDQRPRACIQSGIPPCFTPSAWLWLDPRSLPSSRRPKQTHGDRYYAHAHVHAEAGADGHMET